MPDMVLSGLFCVQMNMVPILHWLSGRDRIGKELEIMYDPKHWKHGTNITVGEFCRYLKVNVPMDAVFHVCGSSRIFLHQSRDGRVFSIDDDSLSELSEYDACTPAQITEKKEGAA